MRKVSFRSIKDVQLLLGESSCRTANRLHIAVRGALGKHSRYLTIKAFCDYQALDFNYIWQILRKAPPPD
jgi:hypothetical protein